MLESVKQKLSSLVDKIEKKIDAFALEYSRFAAYYFAGAGLSLPIVLLLWIISAL